MANIDINSFKAALQDAIRPNRFYVTFKTPTGNQDSVLTYLAKATHVPGVDAGVVEVPWQGMKLKIAGDPTFNEWTCTFIQDYANNARVEIETWYQKIISIPSNLRTAPNDYFEDLVVTQIGRQGETLSQYTLYNAFPSKIADINLSYEDENKIADFEVTFAYSYWVKTL